MTNRPHILCALLLSACAGGTGPPVVHTMTLSGPLTLVHGVPGTFAVTYTVSSRIGLTGGKNTYTYRIDEDDGMGPDDKLKNPTAVGVTNPATLAGSSTFQLTCKKKDNADDQQWLLVGPNGTDDDDGDGVFEVLAVDESPLQPVPDVELIVTCIGAGGKPESVRIINSQGTQKTAMVIGQPETFTIELTLTDVRLTGARYKFDVEEHDSVSNDTLLDAVYVTVRPGVKVDKQSFQLKCRQNLDDSHNSDLSGIVSTAMMPQSAGTSKGEAVHQLIADGEVDSDDKNTDLPTKYHEVTCTNPG